MTDAIFGESGSTGRSAQVLNLNIFPQLTDPAQNILILLFQILSLLYSYKKTVNESLLPIFCPAHLNTEKNIVISLCFFDIHFCKRIAGLLYNISGTSPNPLPKVHSADFYFSKVMTLY